MKIGLLIQAQLVPLDKPLGALFNFRVQAPRWQEPQDGHNGPAQEQVDEQLEAQSK